MLNSRLLLLTVAIIITGCSDKPIKKIDVRPQTQTVKPVPVIDYQAKTVDVENYMARIEELHYSFPVTISDVTRAAAVIATSETGEEVEEKTIASCLAKYNGDIGEPQDLLSTQADYLKLEYQEERLSKMIEDYGDKDHKSLVLLLAVDKYWLARDNDKNGNINAVLSGIIVFNKCRDIGVNDCPLDCGGYSAIQSTITGL